MLVTAGFDPLRDEGEEFASRLVAADIDTTLRRYGETIHGFVSLGGRIDAGAEALGEACDWLRSLVSHAGRLYGI